MVLKRAGKYHSLALMAIEANAFGLTKYWVEMGAPLAPDLFAGNGLDILGKYGAGMTQEQRDEIFVLIAEQVNAASWRSTPTALQSMISPAVYQLFAQQVSQIKTRLTPQ
jgi:hypothetical protein